MLHLLPLTPESVQHQHYHTHPGALGSRQRALLPVLAQEVGLCASSMPLAFVKDSTTLQWQIVAICSKQPGSNLYINAQGQWLGHHQPVSVGLHPFGLKPVGPNKAIAVIDVRSAHLCPPSQGGQPFVQDGKFTEAVQAKIKALQEHYPQQLRTRQAVEKLAKAGILSPWPEELLHKTGITHTGLHTLDEKRLSQLSDADYLGLREHGIMGLAYAVALSMNQLHILQRLERINPPETAAASPALPTNAKGEIDLEFLSKDGTLRFGG